MLLIESDVSMICEEASIEENAIVGCDVKNLGMLEDVARVNHIFCDKTGTLTKNQLIFKGLVADGHIYRLEGRKPEDTDQVDYDIN